MGPKIELDMPVTWPPDVKAMVVEVAQGLHAPLGSFSNGGGLAEREDEFRSLFAGRSIRAFHCTRLLDHEVERIRRNGLLLLTERLVNDRIENAIVHGDISRKLGDELLKAHVFSTREHDNRENMLWFFLSTYVLRDRVGSVWILMRFWGGEAISFSDKSLGYLELLEELGQPTIVVVDLDLSGSNRVHRASPGLLRAFVGRYLGEKDADSVIRYVADVPGERVVDIWQPGHPKYEAFRNLRKRGRHDRSG